MQEIRFKVSLDDTGVHTAAGRTEAAFNGMSRAASNASASVKAFGNQGKLSANDLRLLSMQTSDIAVSLGSGQSPFTVLLQQGAQLRDQFGSVRGVFSAYAQVLNVTRIAAGGAAAVMATLGFAAYQGYEGAAALTKGLVASGNAAGKTRGEVEALARSLADMSGAPIGGVRDAMASLATSGAFVGQNLELAGRASVAMARLSGQSAAEVAQDLAKMRTGVTEYVVTANRQYNFLTVEVYRQIKALEAQGKTQEAVNLALRELATVAEARVPSALGTLERVMKEARKAASEFWDSLLGIGRPETPEQVLDRAQKKVQELERGMALRARGGKRMSTQQGELDAARQEVTNAQEVLRMGRRKVEEDSRRAAEVQDAIRKDQLGLARQGLEGQLALEAATGARSLQMTQNNGEAKRRHLEKQYQQQIISITQYREQVEQLERDMANAEVRQAQAEVARAGRRSASTPAEQAQRKAAVLQAETKLLQAEAARDKVLDEIDAGKFAPGPREVAEDAGIAGRMADKAEAAQIQQAWDERLLATRSGVQQILADNADMNTSLIADDRARGMAIIRQEEATVRRRLDLSMLSVEERQVAEEALAQWRLLREQQLTEQLKPVWQRNADLWADTTRDMAQRYDEFLTGFVDRGRDAFQTFLAEGKLSVSSITSFIRAEFARMAYERFLAGYVRSAANWLFSNLLGSGGSTGGAGMPDDVPTRGGKAGGGYVPPFSAWTVGEKGPEKLIMGRNGGVIVPNGGQAAAAPPVVVNQTFQLTGSENDTKLYQLAALAKQAAMAGVAEERARGNAAFVGA